MTVVGLPSDPFMPPQYRARLRETHPPALPYLCVVALSVLTL